MHTFNRINDFFLLDKTKAQSPSSKRTEILFQLPHQSSSDDTINTLSSSRSLPQAPKTINQVPQYNHPALPKDHGIPTKHFGEMRNGHSKDNYATAEMKGKGPDIRFQKTGNFASPINYHSPHEELDSRQGRPNDHFLGKNVQLNRAFRGRTEEIRINEGTLKPVESNNSLKGENKGADRQYRELAEGENFLKMITEDGSKKEAKGKFKIEFSDISETTSEIWRPNGMETKQRKAEVPSVGLKFQENTKPKLVKNEVIPVNKQEIDGIRVINNNQGKGIGVIGIASNGFMEQLKKFPLKELTMTKKRDFDKRYKLTQSYIDLCEKANQDPLRYYHENLNQGQQTIVRNVEENFQRNKLKEVSDEEEDVLEELEEFPLEELVITKKGLFDKRYKLTQQYLDLCERAGQDPLEYYHENMEEY